MNRLSAGDIVPGQMYVWLGTTSNVNDYTRLNCPPRVQPVNPQTIEQYETFVALQVNHINNKFFDLKVLTSKGDLGYLFRWYIEGVPAQLAVYNSFIP